MLQSYLYEGTLTHRRFGPRDHAFQYRLYMAYLDLDELDRACPNEWIRSERFAWASFLRSDHVGNPTERLTESIKKLVYSKIGISVNGPFLDIYLFFVYQFWRCESFRRAKFPILILCQRYTSSLESYARSLSSRH